MAQPPRPALAVIKSATLTLFSDETGSCTSHSYPAGKAFLEHGQGHVHLGVNLSARERRSVGDLFRCNARRIGSDRRIGAGGVSV